ncbi:MAG TPA: tRNA (uridine(34)/cytosine(34)/5-carboxymethylaminomethyluridine(34)-2'-O)-methyltransferase TrmL [Clostridiaceae bacterium]|nr:tRNA (uridine(34)/cytosine(34)/5-carboxymethylaminomethyluridine(34)-2'-O)-methyltransferase TrmL [Clostridiaceae bacterium]
MAFNIVLVEPEIPQNTGNIARTCAATGSTLYLVKPLGFSVDDKHLKRAGLDYWKDVNIVYVDSLQELLDTYKNCSFYFLSTKGIKPYSDVKYKDMDFLVFGKETAGLPEELLLEHKEECIRIPMAEGIRSLNLSNSVAIVLYEAIRQTGFSGLERKGELTKYKW